MSASDVGWGLLLVLAFICISFIIFLFPYLAIRFGATGRPVHGETKRLALEGLTVGIPLGFTGLVSGYMTGLSHTAVVGVVVPSVLTLIGLLVVYLIDKEIPKAIAAGMAVFLFSANLLMGTYIGSAERSFQDENATSIGARETAARQDLAVQQYRVHLGLPPEPLAEVAAPPKQSDSHPSK